MSPTARALRALEILQTRPGTTADQLAARLGVTERAARRYVEILREAGIPVDSVRGPHGGYRLGRGTRLPPVVFTQIEALALVMAVHDDPDELVGSAIDKVIKAMPESVARQAAALREHASAALDWHAARPDPATTSALVDAVASRRRVVVGYRPDGGREFSTEVEPWAVVVRHRRWYLLCRSPRTSSIRTYRIDRVSSVAATPHAFRPPDDLDPVAALEANLGAGWGLDTHVVFDAPVAEVAPWIPAPMGRLSASASGCELIGSTSNPQMYAQEWLARVPFPFRVLGGPELTDAVAAVAARFAAAVSAPRK